MGRIGSLVGLVCGQAVENYCERKRDESTSTIGAITFGVGALAADLVGNVAEAATDAAAEQFGIHS